MDLIFALIATIAGLIVVDVAAINFGADSRDSVADDHQR
jgi:hypothetical protein